MRVKEWLSGLAPIEESAMSGFPECETFAHDLSFMTDEDWKALEACHREEAARWEEDKAKLRAEHEEERERRLSCRSQK